MQIIGRRFDEATILQDPFLWASAGKVTGAYEGMPGYEYGELSAA